MKNDDKSWNQTIANLLENETINLSGGLWEGSLVGATGSFTHGLTELRIKQGKYTEALEFAEYGRTRILSYLINKNKESSINIDKIKAIAKQQNATLVKYYMPTNINYPGIKKTYKPPQKEGVLLGAPELKHYFYLHPYKPVVPVHNPAMARNNISKIFYLECPLES